MNTPATGEYTTTEPRVVLEAHALTKSFGGERVLDGVDLALREGEVVLLRGPNGCGKTTLLNILSGHSQPEAGNLRLRCNGHNKRFSFHDELFSINAFSARTYGNGFSADRVASLGICRTWQHNRLFPNHSLAANLIAATPSQAGERILSALFNRREVLRVESEMRRAAVAALASVGLAGREDSSGGRVSFGQARRVEILRAVQAGARVLLLDEPLLGLDATGAHAVLTLLERLVRERSMSLVIAEHQLNISSIKHLVTRVWTMRDGRIEPSGASVLHRPDGDASEIATRLRSLVRSDGSVYVQELGRDAHLVVATLGTETHGGLQVENLRVKRGRRLALYGRHERSGLSLAVGRGQVAVLAAPNGWGKSTLVDAVAGILPMDAGKLLLDGVELKGRPHDRVQQGLCVARPEGLLFDSLTVRENLRLSGVSDTDCPVRPHRVVATLSGGERKQLALKIALRRPAGIVVIDEPLSHLDASAEETFWADLPSLRDRGVLICMPSKRQEEGTTWT